LQIQEKRNDCTQKRSCTQCRSTSAGTAIVAGTAGAVQHGRNQHYANQAAQQSAQYYAADQRTQMEDLAQQNAMQQQQIQMMQQQQQMHAQQAQQTPQVAPAPALAPPGVNDLNSQLMLLSQLRNAGVLHDQEFAQAKAKLLGS
jgi:hypothetical protein